MMDDLANIIHSGIWSGNGRARTSIENCRDIANAVRSYLLSEGAVERAASASALTDWPMCDWPDDFSGEEREKLRKSIRAALSSAIGQPEAEYSGWVEVVDEGESARAAIAAIGGDRG